MELVDWTWRALALPGPLLQASHPTGAERGSGRIPYFSLILKLQVRGPKNST